MFDYRDYHRTIVAYHGTTVSAANRLVNGGAFKPSNKIHEWIGNGVYFWEYAPKQAWWWTKDQRGNTNPAVVGAMIRLGELPGSARSGERPMAQRHPRRYDREVQADRIPVPKNVRDRRNLDFALLRPGVLTLRRHTDAGGNLPRSLCPDRQGETSQAGELNL